MRIRQFSIVVSTVLLLAPFVQAAGIAQLELVGGRSAAGAFQEWAKALDKGGISGVRIRSGGEDESNPGIETAGTPERPVYNITGVVLSRDELLLPGGRYKRSEIGRLKLWMDDLAENGLPDKRPAKVAFGLTQPQYDEVRKALAKPLDFETQGLARNEAVEKISRLLAITPKFEDGSLRELGDGKIEDELGDLTSGTALAALLRPAGFCMIPKMSGGSMTLAIRKAKPELKEIWPVGEKPEKPGLELLPEMITLHPVNIQNVPVATAATEIGKRLKAPVLYDRLGLAKHKLDPTKAMVSLPQAKTTYSLALKKILSQAKLSYEIRVDEAVTPFLWIATVKPL